MDGTTKNKQNKKYLCSAITFPISVSVEGWVCNSKQKTFADPPEVVCYTSLVPIQPYNFIRDDAAQIPIGKLNMRRELLNQQKKHKRATLTQEKNKLLFQQHKCPDKL